MASVNLDATIDPHGIELIQELATEATKPEIVMIPTAGLGEGLPENVPVGFDRKNQKLVSVKDLIEAYRTGPERREGTATVETLKSFIELVNRHKDDQSALFGCTTWPNPKLTAVIDYQSATSPARFGRHRITYAFPMTDEIKVWISQNGKGMKQDEFAAFIEEHSPELAAPDDGERSFYEPLFKEVFATPSEVIEMSRQLEVFVNAKAKQGIRLQTGERVVEFAEEHVNAKGEAIVIPGIFMVSVRAFVDGEVVRIPARLRYRISGGNICWFYQLYRWENLLRDAVEYSLLDASKETGLPAFFGTPESGRG